MKSLKKNWPVRKGTVRRVPLSCWISNHFKSINDMYGRGTADEVLKALTAIVRKQLRETDIFCRWGGAYG